MHAGAGPFAVPSNRAFGYRMIIEHLLRSDLDNRMPDGSLISQDLIVRAREYFVAATDRRVWNPERGIMRVIEACNRYRQAAEKMIQEAEERLSLEA